ncbi:MAG: OmpA family protein [Myxococcota bacterium]|nr:OmpA family protein [Myxococcota bacterium]
MGWILGSLVMVACHKAGPPVVAPVPPTATQQDVVELAKVVDLYPGVVPAGEESLVEVLGEGLDGATSFLLKGPESVELGVGERLDARRRRLQIPGLVEGTYDLVTRTRSSESVLTGGLRVAEEGDDGSDSLQCDGIRARFEFDSAMLTVEAQQLLDSHVACFEERPGTIEIEGHCDERGTTEYNLALGNRRASTVRRYLVARGVTEGRIRTVSYGEERPLDHGVDEMAWATNRRAEIRVEK